MQRRLKWQIIVFSRRHFDCLVPQHGERTRNPPPRRVRLDHVVDVAALAAANGEWKRSSYSLVRAAIFSGSPASWRKIISTAPFAPITAICAVGQA